MPRQNQFLPIFRFRSRSHHGCFGFDHKNEAVKYDLNNARPGHNGHLRMFSGIYVTHLYVRPFPPYPIVARVCACLIQKMGY